MAFSRGEGKPLKQHTLRTVPTNQAKVVQIGATVPASFATPTFRNGSPVGLALWASVDTSYLIPHAMLYTLDVFQDTPSRVKKAQAGHTVDSVNSGTDGISNSVL